MDSVSTRTCDHCDKPLPGSLRSDARYCNSTCRARHSRKAKRQPEGARWIKGYWRTPARRSPVRRRRRNRHHSLGIKSLSMPGRAAQRRSQVVA